MKKLIYITMAMMSLFLVSCSDDDTENGLIGTWASSFATDDGVQTNATLVLETSVYTMGIESTIYFDGTPITTSCSLSGDWSSTDAEISFSGGTMSCDIIEEDIEIEPSTTNYVLSENTLSLGSGEDQIVYTRQ